MGQTIEFAELIALADDRFGKFDIACPIRGPTKRGPSARKKVLCVWRHEPNFVGYYCRRCEIKGYASDGSARAKRPDPAMIAKVKAEAAVVERTAKVDRQRKALGLWQRRQPAAGSIVDVYLRRRGHRGEIPGTLGFLPARGIHAPAMISAFGLAYEPQPGVVEIPDVQVRAIHLTKLKPDGSGKAGTDKDKIMLGSPRGYPIVLMPPNDLGGLGICEGIEDALAFAAAGLGAWAAGSAPHLAELADAVPVNIVSVVTISVDDDKMGLRNSELLAERLTARGIKEVRLA